AVVSARCLLPLRLGGQPAASPAAEVARAEPGDDDGGRPLVAAISDPANRLSILRTRGCSETDQVDPGVGVVLVVAALALGRDDALSVEEVGELGVGHLVTLDPEVGDEHAVPRPLLGGAVVTARPELAGG